MLLPFDATIARQRHEEMLREAEQIRLVRKVAKANGAESLLSRMVKLLSRSSRPQQGRTDEMLPLRHLVNAKGR